MLPVPAGDTGRAVPPDPAELTALPDFAGLAAPVAPAELLAPAVVPASAGLAGLGMLCGLVTPAGVNTLPELAEPRLPFSDPPSGLLSVPGWESPRGIVTSERSPSPDFADDAPFASLAEDEDPF